MSEIDKIMKTGGVFLKIYIAIYIFWQVVAILLLMGILLCVGVLFTQLSLFY